MPCSSPFVLRPKPPSVAGERSSDPTSRKGTRMLPVPARPRLGFLRSRSFNRLRKNSFSCFDKLSTNGETSMISMPGPFVLSLSKGEQRVFPQPVKSCSRDLRHILSYFLRPSACKLAMERTWFPQYALWHRHPCGCEHVVFKARGTSGCSGPTIQTRFKESG